MEVAVGGHIKRAILEPVSSSISVGKKAHGLLTWSPWSETLMQQQLQHLGNYHLYKFATFA